MYVERAVFAFVCVIAAVFTLSTCVDHAFAIKKQPETKDETIERLSTELRLRAGELAVARGQLAACRRRCAGSEE